MRDLTGIRVVSHVTALLPHNILGASHSCGYRAAWLPVGCDLAQTAASGFECDAHVRQHGRGLRATGVWHT